MKIFNKFLIPLLILNITSCLEDPVVMIDQVPSNSYSEQLLAYLDIMGFFQYNSAEPALIEAYDLYIALNDYNIIDIRSEEEYAQGHIPGSIRKDTEDILQYLLGLSETSDLPIVLVSKNGQVSSYIQALAIMYGVTDIYSLHFGMAYWHEDFADDWLEFLTDPTVMEDHVLNNLVYETLSHTALPVIEDPGGSNIGEKIKNRVEVVLNVGLNSGNDLPNIENLFYNFAYLYSYYDNNIQDFPELFILCYGPINLYRVYGSRSHLFRAHPPQTRMITPPIKLNNFSPDYILTIPSHKPVAIYSSDGHSSAYLSAILRVLGYNAKSMLYGANSFANRRMNNHETNYIRNDAFSLSKVLNFPYETGNSNN